MWSPSHIQPLLGFYLDLEIVGGGHWERKKSQECDKGKRKASWTRGTEQEALILWGKGLSRAATPRPRAGTGALEVALPPWTEAKFQRSWA